jgi:hypothetical protein
MSFIVIETKNGHANPMRAWIADSESDYINKVRAENQRSGDEFEEFSKVIADDEERHAMRVEIMTEDDYNNIVNKEDLPMCVLNCAARLDWQAPE